MRTLTLITAVLLLTACSREPQSASATPAPPRAPSPPAFTPPAVTPPAPLPPPRTDVLAVRFKEINEKGYPVVIVTNLTGKDIDTISGGFRLNDADGNILHATGWTVAVPNDLFLAADSEMETVPFGLNSKTEPMELLRTAPETLSFTFEARDVTFMGEAQGTN
jgi:hypothetical protein